MKAIKEIIIQELVEKLNSSPFMVVADYNGTTVSQFEELRGKLGEAGATAHVTDAIVFLGQFQHAFVELRAPRTGVGSGIEAQGFGQAGHHCRRADGVGGIGVAGEDCAVGV